MVNWKNVNEHLPDRMGYYLVACSGGNVDKTFYDPQVKHFYIVYGEDSSFNKEYQGSNSEYFELAHKYGYKIMFWTEIPEVPDEVFTDGEDL